jgi:hypothetical protein
VASSQLDQHSDFDAAFAAGVGVSSRLFYRTVAGNIRRRLTSGERVADVAPTVEGPSWADVVSPSADYWRGGSRVTLLVYAVGGFVLAVLGVAWPVLIAVLIAAMVLEGVWRWRRRPQHGRARRWSLRSLVIVTDRRLIEGVHRDEFRELPLERVKDVQVRTGRRGIATLHVSADAGDTEIHITSDWPKRGALPAAEAIAEAIRRGALSRQ